MKLSIKKLMNDRTSRLVSLEYSNVVKLSVGHALHGVLVKKQKVVGSTNPRTPHSETPTGGSVVRKGALGLGKAGNYLPLKVRGTKTLAFMIGSKEYKDLDGVIKDSGLSRDQVDQLKYAVTPTVSGYRMYRLDNIGFIKYRGVSYTSVG